ncbi:conjugal transfer protein TraM [Pseudomonas aeruginosa]|uniref:conjugal transfer protein TraM n=1 Tax=Pseudomonas aeruginosa TaxID=287 RepID=UPI003CC5FDE8
MIDIDEIRKQVAIKHNVLIGKDDPILVTVTINEMVLSRYLDLASERYSDANREITVALQQQQEQAKEVAGRVITDAAAYVSKQVRDAVGEAVKAAVNDAGGQLRQQIADAQVRISEHRDRPFRLIVTGHFANA